MQISAAVVQEVGAPFTLTEVELQEPAPDEVVVEIAGAGICSTGIYRSRCPGCWATRAAEPWYRSVLT